MLAFKKDETTFHISALNAQFVAVCVTCSGEDEQELNINVFDFSTALAKQVGSGVNEKELSKSVGQMIQDCMRLVFGSK